MLYVGDEEITFDPGINILSCDNVLERVFKKRLRKMVEIREEQYGFVADQGTIDAIFILSSYKRSIWRMIRSCIWCL